MTSTNIYCTYVTYYSGNKLPPFYIGSSRLDRINNGYRGSIKSKKWKDIFKNEIKQNPSLFTIEIINTFENREEATTYELELQKSNNVVKSEWFYNESFAAPNGFFGRSDASHLKGMHTFVDECGNKFRLKTDDPIIKEKHLKGSTVGCKWSNETRNKLKIAFANRPKHTDEVLAIIHSKILGKPHNLKEYECPHCGRIGKGPNMMRYHFDKCKHQL